jgi:hypothetical protein
MSSAEQQPEVLDLVIGADGSGVVDAAQLARFGVEPGTHLSVVPVGPARAAERRRSVRGALAGSGPAPSPEDFEAASSAAARDLVDRYRHGGAWDPTTLWGLSPTPTRWSGTCLTTRIAGSRRMRALRWSRRSRSMASPSPSPRSLTSGTWSAPAGRLPTISNQVLGLLRDPKTSLEAEPITLDVTAAFRQIPRDALGDPWDRFITATAMTLGLPLVTRDRRIRESGLVETIW